LSLLFLSPLSPLCRFSPPAAAAAAAAPPCGVAPGDAALLPPLSPLPSSFYIYLSIYLLRLR